jgi:hypothetical protein
MEPQTILTWTCTIIFGATGIITLLGLINKVNIDRIFLNKLFTALILEIVAISILAFKINLMPPSANDDTIELNADVEFRDIKGNPLNSDSASELIEEFVKTNGITLNPPLVLKNSNHFQIYVPRKFILDRGTSLNFGLHGFNEIPIINTRLQSMLKNIDGSHKLDLGNIVLKQQTKSIPPPSSYDTSGTQLVVKSK